MVGRVGYIGLVFVGVKEKRPNPFESVRCRIYSVLDDAFTDGYDHLSQEKYRKVFPE